jgi:cytochrome P450
MVLNPEVQQKAQAAIDAIIGGSRLPDLSDRGTIAYIDAIVYETLRWKPVAPLCPHFQVFSQSQFADGEK